MQRVLIPLAAAAILALGAAPAGSAATTVESNKCPYAPVVAYVTMAVTDDAVLGPFANEWARGAYTKQIVIYRLGNRTFCAITRDSGTFTTEAGSSPAGTGTLSAGITGTMTRSTRSWVFDAKWRPQVATSGSIGTYATGTWLPFFFTDVTGYGDAWWANMFSTATSCFNFSVYGSNGDIVG